MKSHLEMGDTVVAINDQNKVVQVYQLGGQGSLKDWGRILFAENVEPQARFKSPIAENGQVQRAASPKETEEEQGCRYFYRE